jgi:hypothetical protein
MENAGEMFEFIPCSTDFIYGHKRDERMMSDIIQKAKSIKNSVKDVLGLKKKGGDDHDPYGALANIRKQTTGVRMVVEGKNIMYQVAPKKRIPQKFVAIKALSEYKQNYKKEYGEHDRPASLSIIISQINVNGLSNSSDSSKRKIEIICDNYCHSVRQLIKDFDCFNAWFVICGIYKEYVRFLKDYQKGLHIINNSAEWQAIELITNETQDEILKQIEMILNKSNTFRQAGRAIKTSDVRRVQECSYSVIRLSETDIKKSFESEDPRENIGPGMASTNRFIVNALMTRCSKIPSLAPFSSMFIEILEPPKSAVYSKEQWENKLRCVSSRLDILINKFRFAKIVEDTSEQKAATKEIFSEINDTISQFTKNNPSFPDPSTKKRIKDLRFDLYLKYAEIASLAVGKIFNDSTNKKILQNAYKNACVVRENSLSGSNIEKRANSIISTLQQISPNFEVHFET